MPMYVKTHSSLTELSADNWSSLAGDNPFLSWEFMLALEQSGCVSAETGWLPHHLSLHDDSDQLLGIMPLYLKSHSQGEYVFDHNWAEAFQRAGGQYYPKLQSSVPFTPVTGPRLLAKTKEHKTLLAMGAAELCQKQNLSSLHITFLGDDDLAVLENTPYLIRSDQQFHWNNDNYASFDDFLASLSSRKRKNIRKERKTATQNNISIRHLTGDDIKEHHWDDYFEFYINTSMRKWGRPYLNREFFSTIGETMADKIVLMLAEREGRYIAGALNFLGPDTLYGRYWGAIEHHPCLHFELCYYQAIDYAISHKLDRVEAGAQGEHKLARGYVPTKTQSAHFISDPNFRSAVADYLDHETNMVDQHIKALNNFTPFKKS